MALEDALELGEIELEPLGRIEGSLRNVTWPVPGRIVLDGIAETVVVAGAFAFENLLPGSYEAYAVRPDNRVSRVGQVSVVANETTRLDVKLGNLASFTDGALFGYARLGASTEHDGLEVSTSAMTEPLHTDGTGKFGAESHAAGAFTVTVSKPGYRTLQWAHVIISSETKLPDLVLLPLTENCEFGGLPFSETDRDGVPDSDEPEVCRCSPGFADVDDDGVCDHADDDWDNDGVLNAFDNCPFVVNPDQEDEDKDGVGDACDNCVWVYNPAQNAADAETCSDRKQAAGFLPTRHTLPVLRIETENRERIIEKTDVRNAVMELSIPDGDGFLPPQIFELEISGRGNSTWTMLKKPYKLKLDKKASLLGMPKHDDWALLANFSDKTLLRNSIGFRVSEGLDMAWTPRSRAVEVYLNGRYDGVYQLTETVKVGEDRVNIEKIKNDPENPLLETPTGGYLLEIDKRMDEDFCFKTQVYRLSICLKAPKDLTGDQQDYITGYIETVEGALSSENFADPSYGYAQYIDVDSFVSYYLTQELSKDVDGKDYSSMFLHKAAAGKLAMGPVWDFDLSFGNADYCGECAPDNMVENPEGFWIQLGPWYKRLFEDPAFKSRVVDRWWETRTSVFEALIDYIDENAILLEQGQKNNFVRWLILDKYLWPNPVVMGSYDGEVGHLKNWVSARMTWFDHQWGAAD